MVMYVYNLICKDKLEKLTFIYTNLLDLGDIGKGEGRRKEGISSRLGEQKLNPIFESWDSQELTEAGYTCTGSVEAKFS